MNDHSYWDGETQVGHKALLTFLDGQRAIRIDECHGARPATRRVRVVVGNLFEFEEFWFDGYVAALEAVNEIRRGRRPKAAKRPNEQPNIKRAP